MPPPTLFPSTLLLRSLRLSLSAPLSSTTTTTTTTTHQSLPLHHHHHPQTPHRTLHTSPTPQTPPSSAPHTRDRGPASKETTQTDFSALDIYTHSPPPTAQIDACLPDGFHLSNGVKLGNGCGLLLVGGEAFAWKPPSSSSSSSSPTQTQTQKLSLANTKGGQWLSGDSGSWGLLSLVWPKPELLIVGVGGRMMPLVDGARKVINGLGIAVEVQDTRNAAAQFNLLATERGVGSVAAALVPVGWRGGG